MNAVKRRELHEVLPVEFRGQGTPEVLRALADFVAEQERIQCIENDERTESEKAIYVGAALVDIGWELMDEDGECVAIGYFD